MRKCDMLSSSLERDLERKKKENQELTNICDDLINKVDNSKVIVNYKFIICQQKLNSM